MATSIPSPLEGCAKTGLPARWASDTRALVLRFINTMTYFSSLHIGLWARLGLSGGNRLAEIKPIPNQAYQGRTRATPIQSAQIYVTVLRDHPAKIVLLAAEGLSNEVIASRLDTPRQIVSKWRKRFALARLPGLEDEPRGGRPARFSPQRRRSGQSSRL